MCMCKRYIENPHAQVLWLGQAECYSTWEPAVSLPQTLVEQFESGVASEASLKTTQQYGHVSGILTVAQQNPATSDPKRRKLERPCHEDLEGYTYICTYTVVYVHTCMYIRRSTVVCVHVHVYIYVHMGIIHTPDKSQHCFCAVYVSCFSSPEV